MEQTLNRLSAVDTTMGLHEIQIDPSGLKAIHPRRNKPLLPHGRLTRILLGQLRHHDDWINAHDLAVTVQAHLIENGLAIDFAYVMFVVWNLLNGLRRVGRIARHQMTAIPSKKENAFDDHDVDDTGKKFHL